MMSNPSSEEQEALIKTAGEPRSQCTENGQEGIVNLSQVWLIGHVKRTAESLIIQCITSRQIVC